MKKLLLYIVFLFFSVSLFSQSKIYVGEITGDIDLGLVPYVKRTISDAEKNNAERIIFKINTFGGGVDAAT